MTARSDLGRLAVYLGVSLLIIGVYDVAAHWPFPLRLLSANNLLVEYPLVAAVLLLGYVPSSRPGRPSAYVAAGGVLTAYAAFDLFYHYLKRAPRPSDLQNAHLVWDFSPALAGAGLLAACAVGCLGVVHLRRMWRVGPRRSLPLLAGVRCALAGAGCLLLASRPFAGVLESTYENVHWSEHLTVRLNGRLSSFLYFRFKEQGTREWIAAGRSPGMDAMGRIFPGEPVRRPNIHVIVLESFLDPRRVRDAVYSRSPLADELRPFLAGGEGFSRVISPVYGGNSAQAEFELLTGMKAFGWAGTVEFNAMQGGPADGFVRRLKRHGYTAVATVASSSDYFNVARAYRSLGFDRTEFLGDRPAVKAGGMVFDGDLFACNYAMMRWRLGESAGPVFNYVVGMYGHYPYEDSAALRPDAIATDHPDPRINRIANQFYHRTRALGIFLARLRELDPDGVVYVTSDHLPPVFEGSNRYDGDMHENIALLRAGGRVVDVSGARYHEIPWRLWDILGGRPHERPAAAGFWSEAYRQLLAESLGK